MNCTRIQNLVSAYIDRELDGDEMWMVRDHCASCRECSAELEAVRQTKSAARRLARIEPDEETLSRLKMALRLDRKTLKKSDHPFKLVAATLVAALVLGFAVFSSRKAESATVATDHQNSSSESDVYANGLDMPGAYAPASLASQRD